MTVTDTVAALFGEPLDLSNSKIDILCGGSQKALSAPAGLTMLWVSDKALQAMESRKTPIAAFYSNILTFRRYYEDKWFPYTMPISDIYGLRAAGWDVPLTALSVEECADAIAEILAKDKK